MWAWWWTRRCHLLENGVDVTLIQTAQEVVLESSGQEVLRLWNFARNALKPLPYWMSGGTLLMSLSMLCDSRHDGLDHARIWVIRQSEEKTGKIFRIYCGGSWAAELDRVANHFFYGLNQLSGPKRFGMPTGADDFRKTNEKGQGYQPMIYGFSAVDVKC